MESEGLDRGAARRQQPARQFAALRKSNEYHAHVAHIRRDQRELRARVDRVIQAQREHKYRQAG